MLGQKEGLGHMLAQKPQKQMFPGQTTSSWKERNKSNDWKTNSSIGGYMKMPEESAWSQHSDSAASMYPLVPGWEDDFQDLTRYCQESQKSMSYAKEDGTKSFRCIVQDDELNTPEICIPNFDYPTRGNVSSRDDTSPMSLFDEGGMWDIPPPIVPKQTSTDEKGQDIVTSNEVVEYPKSNEIYFQTGKEVESDQLKSDMGVFGDIITLPLVAHEEEIESTEVIMTPALETGSILIYDKETESVQFIESVSNLNEITMIDSDVEANMRTTDDIVDPLDMDIDNSVNSDFGISFENEFNPFPNILGEELKADRQVNTAKEILNGKNFVTSEKNEESPKRSDTVQIPLQNAEKQCRKKTDLSLNLAAVFGTEEMISTPVIMESLLAEEIPFSNLLQFIQPDVHDAKAQPVETASTVDFSEVSAVPSISCDNISTNIEIIKEEPINDMMVQPVVIKKSPDGKLSVLHKQVSDKLKFKGVKSSENQTLPRKRIVKTSGEIKSIIKAENVSGSDDEEDEDKNKDIFESSRQVSPRKKAKGKEIHVRRSRGRPPQQQSATTSKNDTTYPSRQRKTSYRSDFEDIDSPPSKRSRLSSVESEGKYRELRVKNNEASRKSRLNRKTREVEMKENAKRLEKENQSLRIKAEEMERLVKKLRQALLEAVTKRKQNK